MELTLELKAKIDSWNVYDLLAKHRFLPPGDPLYQGLSGEYCINRLMELQSKDPEAYTKASKQIGWGENR